MAEINTIDRRKETSLHEEQPKITITDRVSIMLAGFQLSDVLSTKNHSDDFNDTRSHFILGRLKLMAYVFAILVPISFIVDLLLLDESQLQSMFYLRIMLAVSLIILAMFCKRKTSPLILNYLLPLGFLLPIIFYVLTQFILSQQIQNVDLAGYSFMPYLMVAMLALFPLTITYSLIIIVLIFAPFLGVEIFIGQLITFATFNKVWAFFMFAGVTLWLQTGQLVMLMKLYRESTLDPLTGLINRRVLMKRLEKEILAQQNFYILMFDLDKFKRINDTYGHLDGDLVLKSMAQIIKSEMRAHDIVARFGGEEFVAVLSDLDKQTAVVIAERIRKSCEQAIIINKNDIKIKVTTSIGVTQHQINDALDITFNRADELLYQAKSEGRNRVVSD